MNNARLDSFTLHNYSYSHKPTATGTIYYDGGHISFSLQEPEIQDVMALVFQMVMRKREAIAEAVMNLETPMLLTSDAQTIEGASLKPASLDDDIPF